MTDYERIAKTACTVCQHPQHEEIDRLLVGGVGYRTIAKRFDLHFQAVGGHKRNHLSRQLQAVHSKREEKRSESLLDRVERLITKLETLADEAATAGKASQLLAASRELRESYRLIGKLTGELDERPQVLNVLVSPEWQQVRAVLVAALADYPDARVAVSGRLLELEAGGGASGPSALLQQARIGLPRTSEAEQLAEELLDFELRVNENANLISGAFRTGAHDDLVVALGLSVLQDPRQGEVGLGPSLWE